MSEAPTSKYAVLIAEDNISELRLLHIAIEESGLGLFLAIDEAHNGEEAIIALTDPKKTRYDLILLDLNMPRVPGKDVLGYLRKHITAYHPMVIILSNSDRHEDIHECHELGADAYMQKPPRFDELVEFCGVIRKSIELKQCICIDYIKANYPLLSH